MKIAVTGLLVFCFVGCASIEVTPPAEATIERTQIYQLPFEKVWIRAVDWFANFPDQLQTIIERPCAQRMAIEIP